MKSLIVWYFVIIAFLVYGESRETPEKEHEIKLLRSMYYQATEDKDVIPEGIKLLESLKIIYPYNKGLFEVYNGAFLTLKAKHAFWPHEKLNYAKKGLEIMDAGLKKSPDNVEALFIHGTISDNLPFFMGRSEEATTSFKKIVTLLRKNPDSIDKELLDDIFDYLEKNRDEKIPQTHKITTLSFKKVLGGKII